MFILGLSALLQAYIGIRLLPSLPIGSVGHLAGAAILLAGWLVMVAAAVRTVRRQPLSPILAWSGALAMGWSSTLLALTVLRDVATGLADILLPGGLPSGLLTATAATVPLLAMAITLLGLFNARRRARVVDVVVPLSGLPPALEGFTIAQISDIHVGGTIKGGYLDQIVDAVNGLGADLVAVTGDLVDGSVSQLAPHVAPLARLRSRHGTYFVTGNHEYYSGAAAWVVELRRLGLTVLLNQHVVIAHDGATLLVAGVTDYTAHQFDPDQRSDPQAAMAGAPTDLAARVLLAHQPRSAPSAAKAGFDLQLSGHTHGGQFWPWMHFVRLQQPFTAGLHRLGRLWVYTSRGTGYWGPPKRFGAPSEITRLRLVGV
jgi:predicted MPP superfamily phosphohydrolase